MSKGQNNAVSVCSDHKYSMVRKLQGTSFRIPSSKEKGILDYSCEVWKYCYGWISYMCRWDVLILIWVNISEKNPSDESEWSWEKDLNENLKRNMQDRRNPTNTRAEPFWGFRVFRWAISGFPRKCTGGTHLKVPPDPPDTRNEAVHYFEPRDEFQIFRKLLKTKLKYSTD